MEWLYINEQTAHNQLYQDHKIKNIEYIFTQIKMKMVKTGKKKIKALQEMTEKEL
jgi:hypothetical protein